jgi:hypothetical protein
MLSQSRPTSLALATYRLTASRAEAQEAYLGNSWIVTGIRQPSFDCAIGDLS